MECRIHGSFQIWMQVLVLSTIHDTRSLPGFTTLSATESYQKTLNLSDPPTTTYYVTEERVDQHFTGWRIQEKGLGNGCLRECCLLRENPVAKVLYKSWFPLRRFLQVYCLHVRKNYVHIRSLSKITRN